jgi:hypothetical protein
MMPRYTGGGGVELPLAKRSPLFVAFDNPVPEDVDADADRLMKLTGGVPLIEPNEGRAELGREPREWGDEPFIPGGVRRPSEPIAGAQFPDGATMEDGETEPEEGKTAEPEFKLAELIAGTRDAVAMNDLELANAFRDKIGDALGVTIGPIEEIKPATSGSTGIIDPDDEDIESREVDDGTGDSVPGAPEEETGETEGEQEQEKGDEEAGGRRRKPPAKAATEPGVDGGPGEADAEHAVDRQDGKAAYQDGPTSELAKTVIDSLVKFGLENTDPDQKGKGFTDKIKALLDAFEQTVTAKLEALGDKIKFGKRKLLPLLYERAEWVEKIADESYPFTVEAFERGEQLGANDLQAAGVAFEAITLPTDQVEAQVKRLTRGFASEVVDVVGDDVFKAVKEGLAAEENVYGIAKRIAAVYGEKRDNAAERIARTEVNRALNAGAQETWKAAGVSKNEWLASVDACEFCVAMNGKRVALGEAFLKSGATMRGVDGGGYTAKYGDILHPTLHPNCTCTVVPVLES